MEFEAEYELFIRKQLKKRKGESHRRLKEGHAHAERLFLEQVWWPAVGSFQFLHAEYEVEDFKDGSRFLDFAYIRPPYRICIEIDGYKLISGKSAGGSSRTTASDKTIWSWTNGRFFVFRTTS